MSATRSRMPARCGRHSVIERQLAGPVLADLAVPVGWESFCDRRAGALTGRAWPTQLALQSLGSVFELMSKLDEARFEAAGLFKCPKALCELSKARIHGYRKTVSLLRRCGKLKGVKPRALLVAQLFLKLGNGDLDRLHRNPGAVEPSLDDLQAR